MNWQKFFNRFLLTGLLSLQANAAVWVDSNRWDQNWEDRYSEWVKNSFNEDVFIKGKYKGIATDCADAVYTSRAIFAFENRLPFVILDPSGGDSKISNKMSRWDGDSEMEKFRQFVDYVNEMTDTKSLPRDTYPVSISRDYVRAGAIWSRPRIAQGNFFSFLFHTTVKEDPGHAELVKDVTDTGAILLIGSTVPAAVRPLISTSSLVFMPVETSTGLRKWMEPQWYDQKTEQLPGYSMEQFKMGVPEVTNTYGKNSEASSNPQRNLDTWSKEIQTRLQLRAENKDEALQRYANNLCNLVQARVDVIRKAESARQGLGGACMNADDYDSYSTPSRDKRIAATIDQMVSLGGGFSFIPGGRLENVKKFMKNCPPVQITAEKSLSLGDIATSYNNSKISSNPNDSLEARWGLADSSTGRSCPTY